MTKTSTIGNIEQSFMVIEYLAKEVAFEQMSKVGSDVKKAMQLSFMSNQTIMETIVYNGKARVFKTDTASPLGIRTSHTTGEGAKGAHNTYQFIQSFLMEKHGTLVVGGAMPSHIPLKRRNGEVVGTMGVVGGVSKQAAAILHRLSTGEETADYPQRSKLLDKITPRHFMSRGINASQGIIARRLKEGYATIVERAIKIHEPKPKTESIA